MIRVAYLIDSFPIPLGGTERQLLTLLEKLDRNRFDPRLYMLRDNPGLSNVSFPCSRQVLHLRSIVGPDLVWAGRRFLVECRAHPVDVLHTYFRDSTLAGPIWARLAGIPVVVGSRRNLGYAHVHRDRLALRLLRGASAAVVANSEAAAQEAVRFEGLDRARISVILNGLDSARFHPRGPAELTAIRSRWGFPAQAQVVGAVANLRPVKNVALLVEVAAVLADRFPHACFVVLGDGSERATLLARIRSLGLEGRFALPGVSNEVAAEIQAFDIGVLTSVSESSPNALIEYLAAGRPAVSTDVGGAREILREGDTGFLVPAGDVHALGERLALLLTDVDLRTRMGSAARHDAHLRFSETRMVAEHEALYERLLAASRLH